jgi:hypothetical protein
VISHDAVYDSGGDDDDVDEGTELDAGLVMRSRSNDDWDDGFTRAHLDVGRRKEIMQECGQGRRTGGDKLPPKLNVSSMSKDMDAGGSDALGSPHITVSQDEDVILTHRPMSGRRSDRGGTRSRSDVLPREMPAELSRSRTNSSESGLEPASTSRSVAGTNPSVQPTNQSSPPRYEELAEAALVKPESQLAVIEQNASFGEGVFLADEELIMLLKMPPKSTAMLRTKSGFQGFFRGIRGARMHQLLLAAYSDVGDKVMQLDKVNKRMDLLREVLS